MKLRITSLAILQIAFGAVVFSTNYWPAPMDTQMNAVSFISTESGSGFG